MSAGPSISPVEERPASHGRLTVIATDPPAAAAGPGPQTADSSPSRLTTVRDRQESRPAGHRGGLVAVCGLGGGAGASTLAYLIACAEQRYHPAGAVLAADTAGPGSRLATYAGVQAPRSLTDAAQLAAAGQPVGGLVASSAAGVRVLACGPRFSTGCVSDGVSLLLDHARGHFALSVIDCGTLAREADQIALSKASHVVWVLSATRSAADAAEALLEQVNSSPLGAEIVLARHDPSQPKAPTRVLRRVAGQRHAPLVLMPAVGDLTQAGIDDALEVSQVSLQAIHRQLVR